YRNQLLITLVAMQSLSAGVRTILIGTVASDASHQDGTREFVATIDRLLKCQEGGLSVEAPAIALSTAELIRVSGVPLDLLAWAHSCHTGNTSCGQCRGCNKYLNVYESIGHELERPWNP